MCIYSTFEYFNTLLYHPEFFTRDSKLGLPGLLKFLISRQGYTVASEINHYYLSYELEISRENDLIISLKWEF